MKAAVIGSGGWGTALAICLCKNGHDTVLWSHDVQKVQAMVKSRENNMLPGVPLPESLGITAIVSCVEDCDLVVFATPSVYLRSVARQMAPYLPKDAVLVSATKGIEPFTLNRMSQIVSEEAGMPVLTLTGPSHAEEVARNVPTACLIAGENAQNTVLVQDAFMSDTFRIYTSPDIVGAELGGALKNVIALCAGVLDGLVYGDNAKAMLITRGLSEIARLGVALGGRRETFAGLAGIGDLVVTCTSVHSRNYRAGVLIGKGAAPRQALEQVGAVVEGYYAAKSAMELAEKLQVEMPIIQGAYQVLYEGRSPRQVVQDLLLRQPRPEPEDIGWL